VAHNSKEAEVIDPGLLRVATTRLLCGSEYHELIKGPDRVTQHEDGDDDPEHD
jgi:hypothetical protein